MLGKVKWYNKDKGYGFLIGEDGQDFFAHFTEIKGGDGQKVLFEDDEVEFDSEETSKGFRAINIVIKT